MRKVNDVSYLNAIAQGRRQLVLPPTALDTTPVDR